MGRVVSSDGRFEWDSEKNQLNKENHGEQKYPVMTDKRIAELQDFKTKDFSDCPAQTPEQLKEFKPKYPNDQLYEPIKKTVQISLDADVLEWLKQADSEYQTRVNAILRQAMLQER
jgi:uncharacterized protein (DUF4415 family)